MSRRRVPGFTWLGAQAQWIFYLHIFMLLPYTAMVRPLVKYVVLSTNDNTSFVWLTVHPSRPPQPWPR